MELIVALILGLILGGGACWVVQGSRSKGLLIKQDADHRETVAGLRGQLEQRDNAAKILEAAKEQLSETFQATASRALQKQQ